MESIPGRLIVLGDGPIGLEFADMFAAFGSRVTVVSRHSRLLPREDAEIAAAVRDLLSGHGVTVLLEREVARVGRDAGGEVTVVLEDGLELAGDDVLVAVGRQPVTEELDLPRVVEPGVREAIVLPQACGVGRSSGGDQSPCDE